MFNKKAKQLIVMSIITTLASLLSNVFVNTFFLRVTSDLMPIATYNLCLCASSAVAFPLFGAATKKIGSANVQRAGILLQIMYLGFILLMGDNVSQMVVICGILSGVATSSMAIAGNKLTIEYTNTNCRSAYLSVSGTFTSIVSVVSPLISGFIIARFAGLKGYYITFLLSLVLYVIAFILTIWFNEKPKKSRFEFFQMLKLRNKTFALLNVGQFAVGVRDGIFGFLISIMMFEIVKSEGIYGITTSFAKLIVVAAYFLGVKFINPKNLFKWLRPSMWLMFAAPIPLFLLQNQLGLTAQIIMDSIASPLVAITLNSLIYNKLEKIGQNGKTEEAIAVQQVWLNFGKVAGIAGFMVLYPLLNYAAVLLIVLITNLCYVLSYFLFKRIDYLDKKREKAMAQNKQ